MNSISKSGDFAKGAAPQAQGSRGTIFSDCDCTIFDLKDGTGFYEDYYLFLIAMKKSGYDVVIHSASPKMNEGRVAMFSKMHAGDAHFFDFDGLVVASKDDDTCGLKGLAAFDDNHASHTVKTDCRPDTNDAHVKAAIKKVADEYRASGGTATFTFNVNDFKAPALSSTLELNANGPV